VEGTVDGIVDRIVEEGVKKGSVNSQTKEASATIPIDLDQC
jgi:hypothetical protein